MKKIIANKLLITFVALVFVLTFTACKAEQEGDRTVVKEPDKSITIIDNDKIEVEQPSITIEKIEKQGGEITDWLDEETVVISMDNYDFEKMSLLENSEYYPRSIYLYRLDTKEQETLIAKKNMFLGGGILSPDKKHLLFYEYSIGDTAHYIMNLDEKEQFTVKEGVLGMAITAQWADSDSVMGVSYAGGAYMADTDGNITQLEELQVQEQLLTVQKNQDKLYYITIGENLQLYMLDLVSKEKKNLNVDNADAVIPSPDGKQILITQWVGSMMKLLVADAEGNILRTIAEGSEVTGAAWSPDQQRIAYQLKSNSNGVESSGLYLYDVMTGKSMQIAVNIGVGSTRISWSPSGKKLAVAEYDNQSFSSSIIHLNTNSDETDEAKDVAEGSDEVKDMGYIVAINTEKRTLAIDSVELLLSSDEERIAELNLDSEKFVTGFYIYDEDDSLEWITYDDAISLELLDETELREGSLEELKEILIERKLLGKISVKDNKIINIIEQYTP